MLNIGVYNVHVLKLALRYLLITEIIKMVQPAPMVNLPRSPLHYSLNSNRDIRLDEIFARIILRKYFGLWSILCVESSTCMNE